MEDKYVLCCECCIGDCHIYRIEYRFEHFCGCSHGINKEKFLKRLNYNLAIRLGFRPWQIEREKKVNLYDVLKKWVESDEN